MQTGAHCDILQNDVDTVAMPQGYSRDANAIQHLCRRETVSIYARNIACRIDTVSLIAILYNLYYKGFPYSRPTTFNCISHARMHRFSRAFSNNVELNYRRAARSGWQCVRKSSWLKLTTTNQYARENVKKVYY